MTDAVILPVFVVNKAMQCDDDDDVITCTDPYTANIVTVRCTYQSYLFLIAL